MFKVELVVAGDATYCVRLKRSLDTWVEGASDGVPKSWLPASKLESDRPNEILRVTVTWIDVPAPSAWDAMHRAVETLRWGCPAISDAAVQLVVSAEVLDPRRPPPQGA